MSCIKVIIWIVFFLLTEVFLDQNSCVKGLMWLQVQVPCWNMVLQMTVMWCIVGISSAWILPPATLATEDLWSELISVRFGPTSFEFATFCTRKNRNLRVPKSHALKSEGVSEEFLFRDPVQIEMWPWRITTGGKVLWCCWLQQVAGRYSEGVLKWINQGSLSNSQLSSRDFATSSSNVLALLELLDMGFFFVSTATSVPF